MKISITENNELIWEYNQNPKSGMTSTSYLKDGKQKRLIAALKEALEQAENQLGRDDID